MRLDKFLCDMGFGSRKDVKKLIKEKKVEVNGETAKKGEAQVDENGDEVFVSGKKAEYKKFVYLMLNKPEGVVSANEDREHKTVMSLVPEEYRHFDLFCVGRLDIDTTGLLLLTNDGDFSHHITSPKHKVNKKYFARVSGELNEEDIARFKDGITISGGEKCESALLEILEVKGGESEAHLTISEGKFHQVKRMYEAVGKKVLSLKRVSIGNVVLDESLKLGEMRPLTEEEILLLK